MHVQEMMGNIACGVLGGREGETGEVEFEGKSAKANAASCQNEGLRNHTSPPQHTLRTEHTGLGSTCRPCSKRWAAWVYLKSSTTTPSFLPSFLLPSFFLFHRQATTQSLRRSPSSPRRQPSLPLSDHSFVGPLRLDTGAWLLYPSPPPSFPPLPHNLPFPLPPTLPPSPCVE